METDSSYVEITVEHFEGLGTLGMLIYMGVILFFIICTWRIFEKAHQPGWGAIIPIYNFVVFLVIVNRPIWWIFSVLIPPVFFVISIILILDLAKSFNKSTGFALGLIFLTFIFVPILAFDNSKYRKITRLH